MKTHTVKPLIISLALLLLSPPVIADSFSLMMQQQKDELKAAGFPNSLREAWKDLMAEYPAVISYKKHLKKEDLKNIPDTYKREQLAPLSGKGRWYKYIKPFGDDIQLASLEFDVPEAIIGAVILQESGGKPTAKAKGTSAKGLMQTINATFKLAKKNVAKNGIQINDPLNAYDSIMAGSWYLSYCFKQAKKSFPQYNDRNKLDHWVRTLEYYYAGPKWGKDPRDIVYIKRQGKEVQIHKGKYSDGVMRYAKSLLAGKT